MKKQPAKDTKRVVTDLSVRSDDAVKGGGTSTPTKYLQYELEQVSISSVSWSK